MAVNKNFVVKNGLEVDTNTLFVDSANNRVAIGTTVPTASLDCLLYTSPSPRDGLLSRMPSSA